MPDDVDLLAKGEADAGFLVLAPEAKTVAAAQNPQHSPDELYGRHVYTQRFPFLSSLVLREGVVDFAADVPKRHHAHRNNHSMASSGGTSTPPSSTCWRFRSMTCMASRPSTRAAKHNCFRAPGRFRLPMIRDFEEARRVYRCGTPFLQRYVLWVATTIDRLTLSLVVLLRS